MVTGSSVNHLEDIRGTSQAKQNVSPVLCVGKCTRPAHGIDPGSRSKATLRSIGPVWKGINLRLTGFRQFMEVNSCRLEAGSIRDHDDHQVIGGVTTPPRPTAESRMLGREGEEGSGEKRRASGSECRVPNRTLQSRRSRRWNGEEESRDEVGEMGFLYGLWRDIVPSYSPASAT